MWLNGVLVNTFTGTDPRTKLTGYIGLQNHDPNSHVHFRYLRIKALEAIAPTTTAVLDPAQPGASGFYTQPVEVTLAATDNDGGSGVEATEYRVDGGAWTTYAQPFEVAGDGRHTVDYRSTDGDGNVEEVKQLEIPIDATAPVTTVRLEGVRQSSDTFRGPVTVTLSAADGERGSGVAVTQYNLDDAGWTTYSGPFRVTRRGTHHLEYRSVDVAGNLESNRTALFKIK